MQTYQFEGCDVAAESADSSPDFSCIKTFMTHDTCSSLQMPMSASAEAKALSDLLAMNSPVRLLSMMSWRYGAYAGAMAATCNTASGFGRLQRGVGMYQMTNLLGVQVEQRRSGSTR